MKLKVKQSQAGERLDVVVHSKLAEISRSAVQHLIDAGLVKLNGEITKPGEKLKTGASIEINYDPKASQHIPLINIPVLYEDDDCIVLNKPSGILTHSKGSLNPEATVATFIKPKLSSLEGERAGIVHRLDRATSGVIICAKNAAALAWLQKQFSTRKVKKEYIAIVEGELKPPKAKIDMPIGRNPKKPQTFKVLSTGKPANTTYTMLVYDGEYSLVSLIPETGRTHQLRVHLKQIGHPIVGDVVYGHGPSDRLYLHADKLEITLPNRQRKVFNAPTPVEFSIFFK